MSGALVIVTGPPGAGKTSLCRILAADWASPAVNLTCDHFFEAIRAGFIAPWLPQSAEQNRVINDAIAAAACAYARGGYQVFIDGVVGPWLLDIFREAARRAGLRLDYVVLALTRETAVARARDRAEGPLADYPPRIFEGLADLGPLHSHAMAVEGLALADIAARLQRDLAAGRFRLV
jgi:chloramphenicol 3-O-phosphotransferase